MKNESTVDVLANGVREEIKVLMRNDNTNHLKLEKGGLSNSGESLRILGFKF